MNKKEFKIGEVFQCGLVKLICEKATDLCDGCVFCEGIERYCSYIALGNCGSYYRKDHTDVIFKLVKE